jgi:hypothetical protein
MGVLTEREVCTERSESLSQNGCSYNTLQQQSPEVYQYWLLKTVEANQPHDTNPTSLPLLQPAQYPLEMWELFMLYLVLKRVTLCKVRTENPTA